MHRSVEFMTRLVTMILASTKDTRVPGTQPSRNIYIRRNILRMVNHTAQGTWALWLLMCTGR